MDFGLSFSFVFKDREWFRKIAIPALCSLIPVVGQFIVMGWGLKVTKNVIEGKVHDALPELDFGADLGRGFLAFVIGLIYGLPVAILTGMGGASIGFAQDNRNIQVVLYILGGCLGLLGLLLGILIAFMSVAAIANFVAKGRFGAAFSFKEVFALLKRSFGSWLLVIIGEIIAMGIIAPLGLVVCFIGVFLTAVYGTAVYSHLLGQAYNKSTIPAPSEMETI